MIFLAPLLALCALLQGQVGGPAPELDAQEWFLSRPLTLAELRGRAVLAVALRTWSEPCKGLARELSARASADGPKGLAVIGLFADEEPAEIERWIREQRARFPIVLLGSREFERAAGLDGFPHAIVVDPIGTLAYGNDYGRAGSAIDAALAKATKPPKPSAKLARVREAALDGEYEKAWTALAKLGALEGEDAREAGRWRDWLAARVVQRLERAKALAKAGTWREAVDTLAGLDAAQPAYPCAVDVRAFLAELAQAPNYARELAAGADFAEARAKERGAQYLAAVQAYRAVAKKHVGLEIAKAAAQRTETLFARGLVGLDWSCEACKRAFKACPKHRIAPDAK
jgi:hypothetical protein